MSELLAGNWKLPGAREQGIEASMEYTADPPHTYHETFFVLLGPKYQNRVGLYGVEDEDGR